MAANLMIRLQLQCLPPVHVQVEVQQGKATRFAQRSCQIPAAGRQLPGRKRGLIRIRGLKLSQPSILRIFHPAAGRRRRSCAPNARALPDEHLPQPLSPVSTRGDGHQTAHAEHSPRAFWALRPCLNHLDRLQRRYSSKQQPFSILSEG